MPQFSKNIFNISTLWLKILFLIFYICLELNRSVILFIYLYKKFLFVLKVFNIFERYFNFFKSKKQLIVTTINMIFLLINNPVSRHIHRNIRR